MYAVQLAPGIIIRGKAYQYKHTKLGQVRFHDKIDLL